VSQAKTKSFTARLKRRAIVNVRYSSNRTKGGWKAHGRYLERDSAAGQEGRFFGLVLPHGLLELTSVVIAGGAGLELDVDERQLRLLVMLCNDLAELLAAQLFLRTLAGPFQLLLGVVEAVEGLVLLLLGVLAALFVAMALRGWEAIWRIAIFAILHFSISDPAKAALC